MQPIDERPSVPHDNAPFTMPAETAKRIAEYGGQGAGPVNDKVPVLEARDISKYFGRVIALEHVSLSVRPGEVNCLLGDSRRATRSTAGSRPSTRTSPCCR